MKTAATRREQLRQLSSRAGALWNQQRPQIARVRRFAEMHWQSLWLRQHPVWAIAEAGVAQAVAFFWGILVLPAQFTPGHRGDYYGPIVMILFLSCVVSLLWAAFRMRVASRWWRGLLVNLASAVVLAAIPTILLTLLVQSLLASIPPDEIRRAAEHSSMVSLLLSRYVDLWLIVISLAFLFVRAGIALLIPWNRMRRRSLVWALTNAHLLVVVIGASTLCGIIVLANVYISHSLDPQLIPLLVFFSILTVIAVLVVLPPSALFSYVFARRTTRRLRTLTAATDTLRAGDYTAQVPVEGEDEVAQLQANFNSMATDLASAVHDLETERDTVSQLLEARRELVASVSHELRTPVSTLRGYLESSIANWHTGDAPPAALRHDLEIMERETRHLQRLIEDLFTLARAEVGKLDLRCVPVDVGTDVQRIAEMVAPLAWQSGRVEVIAEVAPHLPPALVDSQRLHQVLQNLVHNGIRHTPPGGIVALSASANEHDVLLQVKDTGEGIAPEDLPHIWERFYRSDSARMQSAAGSGLGLALVKELSEAMGGSVSVESAPGEGSCFTVVVPRSNDAPAAGSSPKLPIPARAEPTAATRPTPTLAKVRAARVPSA